MARCMTRFLFAVRASEGACICISKRGRVFLQSVWRIFDPRRRKRKKKKEKKKKKKEKREKWRREGEIESKSQ